MEGKTAGMKRVIVNTLHDDGHNEQEHVVK
jgi:hypothetical protein